MEGDYIQADETPVGVQMHDGRGKNRQAYLWQYSRPDGSVVFDFRLGREREELVRRLLFIGDSRVQYAIPEVSAVGHLTKIA